MKKHNYASPQVHLIPFGMESVLCTSGTGEGMNPWEEGGPAFIPSDMMGQFDVML